MSKKIELLNKGIIKSKYDPVKRAHEVARLVCKGDLRKYYRFRAARFYGGIATADCLGCCLRCLFCWSWREVIKPERYGRFYTPGEVAKKLKGIVHKKGFHQVRISGNEPTIGREHLLKTLELVSKDILFILETNGILIGYDKTYAKDLTRFKNLYVRVSLKGCNKDEFSKLTGALPEGFDLQRQALENLSRVGVKVHLAVMISFSPLKNIKLLRKRLRTINQKFEDIEIEELVLYGQVENRLKKAKILNSSAY